VARAAVEIPKIGLVMEAVRIARWLKSVGDPVMVGEPLLEVETEKSLVEIEATVGGHLAQILAAVDQEARVGDRIAWIETAEAPAGDQPTRPAPPTPPGAEPVAVQTPVRAATIRAGGRVRCSPVARRLATEHGLDLGQVAGSGPRGRVQLADVQRAIGSPAAPTPPSGSAPASMRLAPMRRALARAMSLSNATVPQFTVERAIDWTVLEVLRAEFSAALGPGALRLSVNDFLLQAVARVLGEHPAMNATFAGDVNAPDARVVPADGAHIGFVIAVADGVLVPVIHHVETLGLAELARRRRDCVERGLQGRLRREELEGATFSISNLGARGPDRFAAMINPPESAILAVGRRRDCVVARDGGIDVRPLSELTLTVDHRVVDGRLASGFLARLVEVLEGRDWRLI
jgi:pyruvate dehydrogenase E2 component (dihydrolipoamide acetyltransferase)